jgi:hypothetical protein
VLGIPIQVVFKSVGQVQAVRKVRATRSYRTDRGSPLNTSHTPIVSSKTKTGPP